MPYYIIYSKTGNEERTISTIRRSLQKFDLRMDFKILRREMINLKKGSKVLKVYNALPGYIFVHMEQEMTADLLKAISDVQDVFFFLHYPNGRLELEREDEKFAIGVFELPRIITAKNVFIKNGDQVEIISGAFTAIRGKVIKIDRRHNRVDVSIIFMEKEMKLTLPFESLALRKEEEKGEKDEENDENVSKEYLETK